MPTLFNALQQSWNGLEFFQDKCNNDDNDNVEIFGDVTNDVPDQNDEIYEEDPMKGRCRSRLQSTPDNRPYLSSDIDEYGIYLITGPDIE
jgi:hypothetical protein